MKVSDYPSVSSIDNTDIVYVIQTIGSAKVSKKSTIQKLFERFNIKTIFNRGINYGTTPATFTNTGTIDLTHGIVSITCTADTTVAMPSSATQGDEIIVLVENNPSFNCVLTGTFATGSTYSLGLTGTSARFIFHYGKWYKV